MNHVQCKRCRRFFGWTIAGRSLDKEQDFSGINEFNNCDKNHDGNMIRDD